MNQAYIPRLVSQRVLRILEYFPSLVVVGARQVGKTTLLRHLLPGYDYVLFDPYVDVENARRDPDLFLDNHPRPIILDEVQYAPEVISAVKRRIDRQRIAGQYVLTGSQQWGIMKQMSESLTGRTVIVQLEPFALSELAHTRATSSWLEEWLQRPNMLLNEEPKYLKLPSPSYETIWRGFLPGAQTLPLDLIEPFHASYQKTYIEKDIRLLADIPDLHLFSRFVRLIAAFTAQEINHQQIGRELGVVNQTAKRWVTLLKEIFEWHEIGAFAPNMIKRISTKPKGYFSDTGQVCFCQAITSPQAVGSSPLWGSLFETAVVNEIRKQLIWMGMPYNLYHWRSHGGAECDLIIERDGRYYPIEIKAKTNPSRSDTSGISAFRKTYPELQIANGLVMCLAEKCFPVSEKDLALPWNIESFQ